MQESYDAQSVDFLQGCTGEPSTDIYVVFNQPGNPCAVMGDQGGMPSHGLLGGGVATLPTPPTMNNSGPTGGLCSKDTCCAAWCCASIDNTPLYVHPSPRVLNLQSGRVFV